MTEKEKLKLAQLEAMMPPKGKHINISKFTILHYYRWKIWLFFNPDWHKHYKSEFGVTQNLFSVKRTINAVSHFPPNTEHPYKIEYYDYANNRKWNRLKDFFKNIFKF